jgi:hypothetical protein
VNLVAGIGHGFVSRSLASNPIQENLRVTSDNSSSNFMFGSVSGNFQVFCNFSGQSDPSSVTSIGASIVNNLKEGGNNHLVFVCVHFLFVVFCVYATFN